MFASSVKNADSPFRNTACQNQNGARRTSRNRTIYAMPLSASGYGETDAPARRIRFWLDRPEFLSDNTDMARTPPVAALRSGGMDKTIKRYPATMEYFTRFQSPIGVMILTATAKASPDFG